MRLFVAVDLPDEARAAVGALARPEDPSVRWTSPEQWHVTVRFLGSVDDQHLSGSEGLLSALDAVPAEMDRRRAPPVRAAMGPAAAWFPGRQVLQVPVAGLEELAAAVGRCSAGWGRPPDKRFQGHLTLARTRGRSRGPASLAGASVSASWPVGEVLLYSSTPGRGGSTYRAVHRVRLEV